MCKSDLDAVRELINWYASLLFPAVGAGPSGAIGPDFLVKVLLLDTAEAYKFRLADFVIHSMDGHFISVPSAAQAHQKLGLGVADESR